MLLICPSSRTIRISRHAEPTAACAGFRSERCAQRILRLPRLPALVARRGRHTHRAYSRHGNSHAYISRPLLALAGPAMSQTPDDTPEQPQPELPSIERPPSELAQQQPEEDQIQRDVMDISFLLNKQDPVMSTGRSGRRGAGSSSRGAVTPGVRGGVRASATIPERGGSSAKPFQCKECRRAFKEKGNLNKHVASVHEKRKTQACPHCSKLFAFKDGLVRHISQVHLNERPFHCAPCRQWFKQLSHLAKHNKTIHKQ